MPPPVTEEPGPAQAPPADDDAVAPGVLQLVLGRTFDDVVRAPSEPIALAAPTTPTPAEPTITCT
jgi:hypothetical protein